MTICCIQQWGVGKLSQNESAAYGLEVKQARKNQAIYPFKMTHERVIDRLEPAVLGSQPKPTKGALSKIEHGNNLPSGSLAAGMAIVLGAPELLYKHPKANRYVDEWIKIANERFDVFDEHAINVVVDALLRMVEQQPTEITADQKADRKSVV